MPDQITLQIDGRPVTVRAGATIRDAIDAAGSETPTLCYDPDLTPPSACRICVVEVKGSRALVPSCSRIAEDGMEVSTDSPRVRRARKGVIELLESSVDTSLAPTIQRFAERYEARPERYAGGATVAQPVRESDNWLYVRDYARIYGLRSVVLRQSCIYGPRQFGVEDQGWVAWMIIAAVTGKQISIYGDGKQIRDLLHVYDLLDAYDAVIENIDKVKGEVFNLGGGSENTMSIWTEFGPRLEKLLGKPIPVTRGDWRPGDQKVFVADMRKAEKELGWKPKYDVDHGVKQLFDWVNANKNLF